MTAPNITQTLDRVEHGDATASDAEALRQHIGQMTVQHVAERQHFGQSLQARVLQAVTRRGYRDGWNDAQFAARQIAKALEELAELGQHFDLPHGFVWGFQECLQEAGQFARSIFDQPERWFDADYDFETNLETLADELADVIIPILVLSAIFEIDILDYIELKAQRDIARGIRNS